MSEAWVIPFIAISLVSIVGWIAAGVWQNKCLAARKELCSYYLKHKDAYDALAAVEECKRRSEQYEQEERGEA